MTDTPNIPRSIGPWEVREVLYIEPNRRCYRGAAGALLADIVVLEAPGAGAGTLEGDVTRSKEILSHEIPKVLDASLARSPYWIASDDAHGTLLGRALEDSGPLRPAAWAEFAKTALIGCAALRSAQVTNFQMSPNTFVVDGDDIHMCNYWSTSLESSPFTPPGRSRLRDLTAADDKFTIGRLLQMAMGLPLDRPLPSESEIPTGYTIEHVRFLERLMSTDPTNQLSTEAALRSIPGRDPSWSVPIFALDKAWQPRMKRRAQRLAIWGMVAAVVAVAALAGISWITRSSGGAEGESASAAAEPSTGAAPTRIVRVRALGGEFPDRILENASLYQIDMCVKAGDLALGGDAEDPKIQELINGKWTTTSVQVVATRDNACGKKEARVSFTGLASNSPAAEEWGPCQSLQVVIPRKDSRKPLKIEYCVEQRTEYR